MKNRMKSAKYLGIGALLALYIGTPPSSFPSEGSGGRGGGDALALEFKATAMIAVKNLEAMKTAPFRSVNPNELRNKINSAQILIVDTPLNVTKDEITQNSTAENEPAKNLIVINRKKYVEIADSVVQQALALHEFLCLIGLENTGNYPISGPYLVATGGTPSQTASATIASATQTVQTKTPCPKPTYNAATLFAMIADSATSAAAIESFVQTHAIGWDVLNDQCETSVLASIAAQRADVFEVLYRQYNPDPNAIQPHSKQSLYSYTLSFSTVPVLQALERKAKELNQPLDLAPYSAAISENRPRHRMRHHLTDLLLATQFNSSSAMIQHLIESGSDVNAHDWDKYEDDVYIDRDEDSFRTTGNAGTTPLLNVLVYNGSLSAAEMVRALLLAKANVNDAYSVTGVTPLMVATSKAGSGLVPVLIDAGALPDVPMFSGRTALDYAAKYADSDTIQFLIERGARPTDRTLLTAVEFDRDPTIIQTLLTAGASPNSRVVESNSPYPPFHHERPTTWSLDETGMTAIMFAAVYETRPETMQILIRAGASVNELENAGESALVFASAMPNIANARTLIQAGADVNVKTDVDQPLTVAALYSQNPDIAELLVRAGAKVNAVDHGHTALYWAQKYKNTVQFNALKRLGAH